MCGIIAIKKDGGLSPEIANKMLSTLSKRGPDDRGILHAGDTTLGQTRLAIVDIKGGRQPMRDNSLPLSIVFNGEIYGYKELKKTLEAKGHRFSTESDTEVILKSYTEYGRDCVRHLDGMFAFVILDERTNELFMARDRFGKKPLYYAWVGDIFLSASEIKAIFESGLMRGDIDKDALADYLRLGYIPPHKTVYKNIFTLPPAHASTVKDGKINIFRYWNLEKTKLKISPEEAKSEIKRLFDEAVQKRMVADVEIGTLLSGGVDSTLVTHYAQKYSKSPIKTFSVYYDSGKSEQKFVERASQKIGTRHFSLQIGSELANELEKIIAYMDEPHADSSNFPQSMISALASSKVKVAMTGDGADELFMGYGWYQKHWNTPRWRPKRWFGNPFSAYKKTVEIFNEQEIHDLLGTRTKEDIFEKTVADIKNPIEKINSFDLNFYLPGQLLYKIDRTSMMNSLEVRSPFLDTHLAEFVYNLPPELKISKTENKIILKEILAEIFPKEFVYRRKQGFGAPIASWLKENKMLMMTDSLLSDNPSFHSFISKEKALEIRDRFERGERGAEQKLWALLCLALWLKKHEEYHI